MNTQAPSNLRYKSSILRLLVLVSGFSALSWTVIWQILSSLALGVSSWGAALTLAITMGGMCIGALLAGRFLKSSSEKTPVKIYGILEILIGLCGFMLIPGFAFVETLDTAAYKQFQDMAAIVHIAGISLIAGLPAIMMGATMPVFGLAAKKYQTSISVLYGLNTLGAAAGSIIAAFILIPVFAVSGTIFLIAVFNIVLGVIAIIIDQKDSDIVQAEKEQALKPKTFSATQEYMIVFVSGFATLALEVAWFRSLTAAFHSTTAAFSIMLASVLVALGVAARLVPLLKFKGVSLGVIMACSGIAILLATPVVERFDLFISNASPTPFMLFFKWFTMTLYVTGIPMLLMGIALPWILDEQSSPKSWGRLYALNTFAAVAGSLCAGWIFLPLLGFAKTAWFVGFLVLAVGGLITPDSRRYSLSAFGVFALVIAVVFESGVGKTRVQSKLNLDQDKIKIIASLDGPDNTVSVVEFVDQKERALIIDGFVTTTEIGQGDTNFMAHYMLWMGHLPMLLHPDPKDALVICFGTGQTAHALRQENPRSLDIVDINKKVFKLAQHFPTNHNILDDKRVTPITMDGRAFMRRTAKKYDIVTLEPMPPTFAGVNSLYSREFYQIAHDNMTDDGVVAQWVPFHLLSLYHSASIAKTFQDVFQNSILWIDPKSYTGILVGSKNEHKDLVADFPGFSRNKMERIETEEMVRKAVYLTPETMKEYGTYGDVITDDNQLLAYGQASFVHHSIRDAELTENYALLERIRFGEKTEKTVNDAP